MQEVAPHMSPDVSVLIVNYNVKDYLQQCLRSVQAARDGLIVQIVVVDNASTDASMEDLPPLFPDVIWVASSQNLGFGKGNNLGLSHCTGRYVLFLNPDTIIQPDTLRTMVTYLDAHPEVGLAGCTVYNPDGTFQLACRRGFPSPWASFTKLFGLQALFPRSRWFAQYNMTYLPIEATYDVDALIGAFMIGPRSLIEQVGGFDPAFFMYGEDLDLCYRVQKLGRSIRYVHTTSIVHFKGESTRRSSMDDVHVFYDAMKIFARKHYGRSAPFLLLLNVGIVVRSLVEKVLRRKRDILMILLDGLALLGALLLATSVRFEGPFGFPEYAYPLVLIVVPTVALLGLFSVGEYVEYRPTIRRSLVGLLVSFFVLSSLTYFFKEYAFSRGVVLMTIGVSAVLIAMIRGVAALVDARGGAATLRSVIVVGLTPAAASIIEALRTSEYRTTTVAGAVATSKLAQTHFADVPVIGTTDYLETIIADTGAEEVIIADPAFDPSTIVRVMKRAASQRVRYHFAEAYDDVIMARLVQDVVGVEPTVPVSPLLRFRNRWSKRVIDLVVAIPTLLILGIPVFLGRRKLRSLFTRWTEVLRGSRSVVGLYPDGRRRMAGKPGMTSLVEVGSGSMIVSRAAVEHINDYYVAHYSVALDIEIMLKYLVGHRGIK